MNDFRLRRVLVRILGVQSPDVTKLRDGALLIQTPTYSESIAVSRYHPRGHPRYSLSASIPQYVEG